MSGKETFVPLSSIEARKVDWLWEPLIPFGMITIMEGDPGEGKSFLAMHLAAVISTGGKLPDGTRVEQSSVLYVSAEDDASYTIRPRIDAMSGDTKRIWVQQSDLSFDEDGFDNLIDFLEAEEPSLVIVDPLVAYVPSKTDMHRSNSIRPMLGKLKQIAEDYGCAIVLVRHLTKMKHDKAIYQGGGSVDLIGAARSAFLIAKDPRDDTRRILAHVKHNIGPRSESWLYELHIGSDGAIPRIRWHGKTELTIDDLNKTSSEEQVRPLDQAVEFLRRELEAGPAKAAQLKSLAQREDISGRTLDRAKKKLGVRTKQKKRKWYWSLPEKAQ